MTSLPEALPPPHLDRRFCPHRADANPRDCPLCSPAAATGGIREYWAEDKAPDCERCEDIRAFALAPYLCETCGREHYSADDAWDRFLRSWHTFVVELGGTVLAGGSIFTKIGARVFHVVEMGRETVWAWFFPTRLGQWWLNRPTDPLLQLARREAEADQALWDADPDFASSLERRAS